MSGPNGEGLYVDYAQPVATESMSEIPESVYEDAARQKAKASRHPLADDEATIQAIATHPAHRAAVEVAYRAGFERGYDEGLER